MVTVGLNLFRLRRDLDADFWIQQGGEEIANSLEQLSRFNERVAKNVILFVGDGMSVPTVTSARWYKEQQLNNNFKNPESGSLTFEKFPFVGLSKVR